MCLFGGGGGTSGVEKIDNRGLKKVARKFRIFVGFEMLPQQQRQVVFFCVLSTFLFLSFFFEFAFGNAQEGFCQRQPSDYEKMEKFRKEFGFDTKIFDQLQGTQKLIEERRKMYDTMASLPQTGKVKKEDFNKKM